MSSSYPGFLFLPIGSTFGDGNSGGGGGGGTVVTPPPSTTSSFTRPVVEVTGDTVVAQLSHAEKIIVFPITETYIVKGVQANGVTDMNWPVPCTIVLVSRNVNPVLIDVNTKAICVSDGALQPRSIVPNGSAYLTFFQKSAVDGTYFLQVSGDLMPVPGCNSLTTVQNTVNQSYAVSKRLASRPVVYIENSNALFSFDPSHMEKLLVIRPTAQVASVYDIQTQNDVFPVAMAQAGGETFTVEIHNYGSWVLTITWDQDTVLVGSVSGMHKIPINGRALLNFVRYAAGFYEFLLTGDLVAF